MKDSYIDRANEMLSLVDDGMISEEELTEGIADLAHKYPGNIEEVEKIMEEIGYLNVAGKENKTSASISLNEIKRKIKSLPGPLAISLAALLAFEAPSNSAWAKELSSTYSKYSAETNGMKKYKVVKNDNFGKISRRFNISVAELQRANPDVDSKRMQIGQVLNIPAPDKESEYRSKEFGVYIVRPGDTLSKVANSLGVSVDHLKELNGFSDRQANEIKVKQKIKTLDIDRLARAFIYVETFGIPESKKDIATGDHDEALGCLQFHDALFKEGARASGISVRTNKPGSGEWWIGDDRTNRRKCYLAFKGVCKKYSPISVEEMLKKAHWNPRANVRKYLDAYNNDLGKGIRLE